MFGGCCSGCLLRFGVFAAIVVFAAVASVIVYPAVLAWRYGGLAGVLCLTIVTFLVLLAIVKVRDARRRAVEEAAAAERRRAAAVVAQCARDAAYARELRARQAAAEAAVLEKQTAAEEKLRIQRAQQAAAARKQGRLERHEARREQLHGVLNRVIPQKSSATVPSDDETRGIKAALPRVQHRLQAWRRRSK